MKRVKWDEEKVKFLEENYSDMTNPELAKYFETTVGAIERQAAKRGLSKSKETVSRSKRKWSDEKIAFLKANYKKMKPKELASILGITLNNLYNMAKHYGLQESTNSTRNHKKSHRLWEDEEVEFLLANYEDKTLDELSKSLNRSKNSITYKMTSLNIRKYKRKENWNAREDEYLKKYYKDGLMLQMMKELNRSFKAIHTRANLLDLHHNTSTYIEREVEEILKSNNVKYVSQYRIRGFIADFLIGDNLVIEVQGDYWHCNPLIYNEPQNEIQKHKIKQDRMKRGCFNELGYKILYVWEYDLNNNYEKTLETIKQFCRLVVKVAEIISAE